MESKIDRKIHNEQQGDAAAAELRREYVNGVLHRRDLLDDPVEMFRKWFADARAAGLLEPNAMTLATAEPGGQTSARTVLLKAFDQKGFVFFTNYGSRKARHIAANPNAALLFPWLGLERQVEIEGRVEKITAAESAAYFLSRPFGSRVGAWISEQSSVVSSRSVLEAKFRSLAAQFARGEIPKPDWWGGFRLVPQRIEFWQGGPNRIHDRFLYTLQDDGNWRIERLQP